VLRSWLEPHVAERVGMAVVRRPIGET
jgi:hypothetical protein